jgi:signal transduction histidine kinase/putative methionine-R-sulfoxide reductase with GAF domain
MTTRKKPTAKPESEGKKEQDLLRIPETVDPARTGSKIPFWAEIRELIVLNRVGRMVSSTLDLDGILNEVVRIAAEAMSARSCSIFLVEGDRVILRATYGRKQSTVGKIRLAMGQGITGLVAKNREPIAVRNVKDEPRFHRDRFSEDYPAFLSVPLLVGDSLTGVINVQDDHERDFSRQEISLLSNLGAYIAGAIRNAQIYREAAGSLREIQSFYEMGRAVSSTLDLPDLLLRICRLSAESLSADGSILRLWDRASGSLDIQSSFEQSHGVRLRNLYQSESKLANEAFEHQKLLMEREAFTVEGKKRRVVTFLTVPIASKANRVGTLSLFRVRSRFSPFSEQGIRLIRNLTSQAGIAIHNSELFSQTKRAEQALRDAQEELIRKERLAALGTVSAGIAHELRNPLVSIGGFALRLQKDRGNPERIAECARVISSEVHRLEQLVRDILVLASPQQVNFQEIDLERMVNEMVPLLRERAGSARIVFTVDIPKEAARVSGDGELVRRALLNIMFNAIEEMPEKGTLAVSAQRLSKSRWIEIEVRDTGPGIDPTCLERIFEPFFTQKRGGTGLGLPIAANIIDVHGGTIRAENHKNGGARFFVTLPVYVETNGGREVVAPHQKR